jgi:hypothetical protein
LVHLFLNEEEDSPNLKKWFLGEIIENSIARASQDKFLNQESPGVESQLLYKEAQAHIYRLYSLYTHISYSALLDSFDVYNRDFDFQKLSAFHYLNKSALSLVRGTLETAIIALKHFYRIAGDPTTYGGLNTILGQLSPRFLSNTYVERVKQQTENMRERFPRR